MIAFSSALSCSELGFRDKLASFNWGLIALICLVSGAGFLALYSAAGGKMDPWASRQLVRFCVGLGALFCVGVIDLRLWSRFSYLLYACTLLLLVAVEIKGFVGMGAQRWIDLGVIQLQPSEVMKITLVLALARYFSGATLDDVRRIKFLIPPALMIFIPVALVLIQPDLGTALMLIMVGVAMFFLSGVSYWVFGGGLVAGLAGLPVAWQFLHDYQKQRIRTFLDPESDPLGAGYHIMQSKIALGSGGIRGKGFLQGTQSHLNFLPEKQTDFIFTLFAEEWGLLGALLALVIFGALFLYCTVIALRSYSQFGRLLAMGLMINFALYVVINIAMVTGLIPVVGVPLPLISYGGTAMMAVLIGFGLIMSVYIHRDIRFSRRM